MYEEFWQAPSRIWQPRVRQLSEEEMEAVVVSRNISEPVLRLILLIRLAAHRYDSTSRNPHYTNFTGSLYQSSMDDRAMII